MFTNQFMEAVCSRLAPAADVLLRLRNALAVLG
jgi:hypothetical protein